MQINKKKFISILGIIVLSLNLSCNYIDKILGRDDDDDQEKIIIASLLLLANSSTSSSGLTIKIPDGVPLTSDVGGNFPYDNMFFRFLKSIGVVSTAKAGENEWAFVRQSALWANNNTDAIEAIINPIKQYGLVDKDTTTEGTVKIAGNDFFYRVTPNANTTTTASAFSGSKTFVNKYEMWRSSDNEKALELFFDSVDSLDANTNGILMLYNLNVLDSASFPDYMVIETYVANIDNSQKQTISWSGIQQNYSGSDKGRVVLELMENNSLLCFKSIVRFDGSNFSCQTANTSQYYALAYTQNFSNAKKEATAKLSLAEGSIDNSGKFCGYYDRNYGLFEKDGGFVSDETPSSDVPSSYPATTRVDQLFSEIGTVGLGDWDDTSKDKLDNLSISFADTSAP